MGEFRKWGPCVECVAIKHDERDKEIHGLNLCGAHYQAHLRRRKRSNGDDDGVIADRHITEEILAHQFIAERFQKFLHVLNHQKVTLLLPAEQIQEIRLLLNPVCVRSQRIAVPHSLPLETLIDIQLGEVSPEDSEATVASAPLGALAMAKEARRREIKETLDHQREQHSLAGEVITAGFNELSREKYHDGDRFKKLTLAVQLLRSFLTQRSVTSEPGSNDAEEMEP